MTMQKISKPQNKKQPLNKERYFEKSNKAYHIYSRQIGTACNKNLTQEENRHFEKVKAISSSKNSFSSSKTLQPVLTLKKLSDDHLLSQTKTLVQKERKLNIEILQHLQEIESRKLYLERGFSSLFDYAVRELGYSRGSAFRRIKAMKLCQDIPETKSQLESGKLNLSSASQLQNFFEKQARKPLKKDLKNNPSSQKTSIESFQQQQSKNLQSDKLVLMPNNHHYRKMACDSSTQKCCSETLIQENLLNKEKAYKTNTLSNLHGDSFCAEPECSAEPQGLSLTKKKELLEKAQGQSTRDIEKILIETDSSCTSYHQEKTRFIGIQKVEFKVILDEDCFKNLETLKNLLSHKNPRMSYGELINLLAELVLKKYDPSQKLNQKQKLARKQKNQKALQDINLSNNKQNQNICLNQGNSKKSLEKTKKSSKEPFVKIKQLSESKSINEFSTIKKGCKQQNQNSKITLSHTNFNLFNQKENHSSSCLPTNGVQLRKDTPNKNIGKKTIQNESPANKNLNKPKIKNEKILNERTIQSKPKKNNRSIPQKIRRYIWKRDQGECSYVCIKTKNKCRSKHLLQIDHIQPFALGGSHHPDNLRLLCARHNQYRSQRTFDYI